MPMEIESASAMAMAMKVVSRAERRIGRDYYGFEIGAVIGGRLRSGRSTSQTAPSEIQGAAPNCLDAVKVEMRDRSELVQRKATAPFAFARAPLEFAGVGFGSERPAREVD